MKANTKKSKKKDVIINFRATLMQKRKIQEDASNLGMSMAQYLLYLSEHREIVVMEEGKELVQAVYHMNCLLERLDRYPFLPVNAARDAIGKGITKLNQLMMDGGMPSVDPKV